MGISLSKTGKHQNEVKHLCELDRNIQQSKNKQKKNSPIKSLGSSNTLLKVFNVDTRMETTIFLFAAFIVNLCCSSAAPSK